LGTDGSRTALCTFHVRRRSLLGEVEYEPETAEIKNDDCKVACVDCAERERTQGDAYSQPIEFHFEAVAENCDVAWYALSDIISTLEICADRATTDEQVEQIQAWQKVLRGSLDFLDTSLNEHWSLSAKFSDLIAEINGEEDEQD
jgi:hypothetical protein